MKPRSSPGRRCDVFRAKICWKASTVLETIPRELASLKRTYREVICRFRCCRKSHSGFSIDFKVRTTRPRIELLEFMKRTSKD